MKNQKQGQFTLRSYIPFPTKPHTKKWQFNCQIHDNGGHCPWLGRLDSNQRNAGVKVLCLANLATAQYQLQLATPYGQFWIANLLMEAARMSGLYCIALLITYLLYHKFFKKSNAARIAAIRFLMVRVEELESSTPRLKVWCSTD